MFSQKKKKKKKKKNQNYLAINTALSLMIKVYIHNNIIWSQLRPCLKGLNQFFQAPLLPNEALEEYWSKKGADIFSKN